MDERNERLTDVFADVGRKHGYRETEASFTAFRDMKVKWCRSYNWIRFDVSDYLTDAPEGVIRSIADTIFTKIRGEGDVRAGYSDEVTRWVSAPEFARTKQPLYVSRCRGLSLSSKGDIRDIRDSYLRLIDLGLVDEDPDVFLGWGPYNNSGRSGFSSVLMKTVALSRCLDRDRIPDGVVDYCLYSHLAHISMGFDPFGSRRGDEYEALMDMYPDREAAELLLKQNGVSL